MKFQVSDIAKEKIKEEGLEGKNVRFYIRRKA